MDNDTLLGVCFSSVCGRGILGGIALLVVGTIFKLPFGINLASTKCAACGAPVPRVARIPKTPYQAAWGGWTCENCGLELDKWGNPR